MAELADAHGSGPCPRKWVGVQLPPAAIETGSGELRAESGELRAESQKDMAAGKKLFRFEHLEVWQRAGDATLPL